MSSTKPTRASLGGWNIRGWKGDKDKVIEVPLSPRTVKKLQFLELGWWLDILEILILWLEKS